MTRKSAAIPNFKAIKSRLRATNRTLAWLVQEVRDQGVGLTERGLGHWRAGRGATVATLIAVARALDVGVRAIALTLPAAEEAKFAVLRDGASDDFDHISDVLREGWRGYHYYRCVLHFDNWPRHDGFACDVRVGEDHVPCYRTVKVTLPGQRAAPLHLVVSGLLHQSDENGLRIDFGLLEIAPDGEVSVIAPFLCNDVEWVPRAQVVGGRIELVCWFGIGARLIVHTPRSRTSLDVELLPERAEMLPPAAQQRVRFPRAPHHQRADEHEEFLNHWRNILLPPEGRT